MLKKSANKLKKKKEKEKTIVRHEKETSRQLRLLDISWKPDIKPHITGV